MKDGKSYLARIAEIRGWEAARAVNRDGQELKKFLDSEIGKAEGGTQRHGKKESQEIVSGTRVEQFNCL